MTDISREVCEEYLDALVTVELAVKFAQLEDRKINATIRATVTELLKRIRDKKSAPSSQVYPVSHSLMER